MKDINLLPEDIKSTTSYTPNKPKAGVSPKVIVTAVFVVLFIGATLVAPRLYISALEGTLNGVKKEIEDPKYDEVKKVNADIQSITGVLNSKNEIMNSIDKKAYPINEILTTVNGVVPKGCKINRIEYNSNLLTLSGNAEEAIAIAELVSRIQRLGFVEISEDISVDQTNTFTLKLKVGASAGKAGE
ncbi:MAG: hypothetical protein BWY74_01661 [Firmicutes bacterium ADurb.Bin419]|nr:MAG: hypothetical protein BWY74_01661 [Firmicutes bacterium ADurb.Bin419]